jgi:hypothetical protein
VREYARVVVGTARSSDLSPTGFSRRERRWRSEDRARRGPQTPPNALPTQIRGVYRPGGWLVEPSADRLQGEGFRAGVRQRADNLGLDLPIKATRHRRALWRAAAASVVVLSQRRLEYDCLVPLGGRELVGHGRPGIGNAGDGVSLCGPWSFPWSLSERISGHLRASQGRPHASREPRTGRFPPSSPVSPITGECR